MIILGIWDGHDAGAALIDEKKIICAMNEERFSRRKLDIGFPYRSIQKCLEFHQLKPENITHIAFSTADVAKTLTRSMPYTGRSYYNFRRKISDQRFGHVKRCFKYSFTSIKGNAVFRSLSQSIIRKRLAKLGFEKYKLFLVDHHQAHAASVMTSNFKKALSITVDGVGDASSSSVNIFENSAIRNLQRNSSLNSLGTFFEQVTNLLDFRELEDEGKVMALADYSSFASKKYEGKYDQIRNPLDDFFIIDGMKVKAKHNLVKQYYLLKRLKNASKPEDFAFFAQKTLENKMLQLFTNSIQETGIKNVCWSGGVASNIKCNQIIRTQSGLRDWFVFPHMGDGGLALGAAMLVANQESGASSYCLNDAYLGAEYSDEEILSSIRLAQKQDKKLRFEEISGSSASSNLASDIVLNGNIVLWYQGRSEYGPRALGNRSILAPSWKKGVRNELNNHIKRRDYFQPFCPTMLCSDAKAILSDFSGRADKFMTMGYYVKNNGIVKKSVSEVVSADNSVRPQMLDQENPAFRKIITNIKKERGLGIVLNTSFNIHGEPLVETPADAIKTMIKAGVKDLIIGKFHIKRA